MLTTFSPRKMMTDGDWTRNMQPKSSFKWSWLSLRHISATRFFSLSLLLYHMVFVFASHPPWFLVEIPNVVAEIPISIEKIAEIPQFPWKNQDFRENRWNSSVSLVKPTILDHFGSVCLVWTCFNPHVPRNFLGQIHRCFQRKTTPLSSNLAAAGAVRTSLGHRTRFGVGQNGGDSG